MTSCELDKVEKLEIAIDQGEKAAEFIADNSNMLLNYISEVCDEEPGFLPKEKTIQEQELLA